MVTGAIKNKVDKIWTDIWAGGITNPLTVIEQLTYLMFIHDLDSADNQRAKESAMLGLPHKSIFAGEVQVGEWSTSSRPARQGSPCGGAASRTRTPAKFS